MVFHFASEISHLGKFYHRWHIRNTAYAMFDSMHASHPKLIFSSKIFVLQAGFQIDAFIPACDWLTALMRQSYWLRASPS